MSAGSRASTGISGAREGSSSGLRRLLARAAARDLCAFVVPGPEVARAAGLDLEAAGLSLAAGPRQANVLAVVIPEAGLPEALERAAEVAYAQMPRPRAVLTLGSGYLASLPANARCEQDQASLETAVGELRLAFRQGAFVGQTQDFEAPALETRTTYTCPMHPEVEQEEPGQCPKCGMDLVPKESTGGEAGMHHGNGSHDHGASEEHEHHEHGQGEDSSEAEGHAGHGASTGGEHQHGAHEDHDHEGQARDSGEHEAHAGDGDHGDHAGGHDHGGHGEMDFMSMVEMTQGTPRSSDGLQMEWVGAPFGPLMPGLPGGLSLTLTLDGDTVAGAEAIVQTGSADDLLYRPALGLAARLSGLDPRSPISYRQLVTLALEDAAGAGVAEDERLRRIAAVELERAASHAGWLAGFASLLGLDLLSRDAARLEIRLRRLPAASLQPERITSANVETDAASLSRRFRKTRLLGRRLHGVGALEPTDAAAAGGPIARAAGQREDLRSHDADYASLGFDLVLEDGSDALSRLRVRLTELEQSLRLARAALRKTSAPVRVAGTAQAPATGSGSAALETPRGAATLNLGLEDGEVSEASLQLPSSASLKLAETLAVGRELGDALAGVASLDISPWGLG